MPIAEILPESAPEQGQLVQVRSRRWLVEEVTESTARRRSCASPVPTTTPRASRSRSLGLRARPAHPRGGALGRPRRSRASTTPRAFAAYLHTLRWNCVTATDPNLFQAPFRAGIKIDAYQLEPLRKALRLPRVNLFIADDVGLGKTIEAGLIARELLLRKKAKTIVVAAPAVGARAVEGRAGGALRPRLRDPRPRTTSRACGGSAASA